MKKDPLNDLPGYDFKLGGSIFVIVLVIVACYIAHQLGK